MRAVFVVARFAAQSAFDCWFELLLRRLSAAQLIVAVRCENKVASLCFTFISGVVTRR